MPILAVAAFRKTKKKRRIYWHNRQKSGFVKENCLALTATCGAPTVIEEGVASIRAAKMAKSFLTPQKFKATNIANFWA